MHGHERVLFTGGKSVDLTVLKGTTVAAPHGIVVRASARETGGPGSNPGRNKWFFRRISAVP